MFFKLNFEKKKIDPFTELVISFKHYVAICCKTIYPRLLGHKLNLFIWWTNQSFGYDVHL